MNKKEFLKKLKTGLSGLPEKEVEERISFYSEMIDDRIEEGFKEEDAIRDIGDVNEITKQIIKEIPLTKIVKERVKPKHRMRAWEVIILILGSPIWLSLLIVLFCVIFTLYAVLWSLVLVLWAVFGAITLCVPVLLVYGIFVIITGNAPTGFILIAASNVLAGLSILLFMASLGTTKGIAFLTKEIGVVIKKCFVKKED